MRADPCSNHLSAGVTTAPEHDAVEQSMASEQGWYELSGRPPTFARHAGTRACASLESSVGCM